MRSWLPATHDLTDRLFGSRANTRSDPREVTAASPNRSRSLPITRYFSSGLAPGQYVWPPGLTVVGESGALQRTDYFSAVSTVVMFWRRLFVTV